MKKLFILITTICLVSCKKEYMCECSGSITKFEGSVNTDFDPYKKTYTIKDSKRNAEKKCKDSMFEVDYYTYRTVEVEDCELK